MQRRTQTLMTVTAVTLGLGLGWMLSAQEAKGPQWKDRAEYDIVTEEYGKAKDAKGRLAALEKWSKAYPETDFWNDRENAYLGIYGEMKDYRKAFDRATAIRAKKPEYYFALTALMTYLPQLNPRTDADYAAAMDAADYVLKNEAKVFDPSNKPSNYKDDQFAKEKPAVQLAARQTKVYVLTQQKKTAELETLLTQFLKEDPTQAAFNYQLATNYYAQRSKDQSKWVPAIFHFTRAGVYTGPNALTAANAKIASDASKSAYKAYHGGMTDYEKVVEVAKNNALPPPDFTIVSVIDLSKADAEAKDAWNQAHPELVFWRENVQIPLTSPGAAGVFESNFKGALLPPPGLSYSLFRAKIVSMTPETNPKEMIVERTDPDDPNDVKATVSAKLLLDPPLPGTMPIGSEIQFKGVAKEFQSDPLQVTFEIDPDTEGKVEGWTGTAPANTKQKGKAPASKGGGKNKAKK